LHNKLENTPDINNIDEEWEKIKEAIMEAAKGTYTNTEQTPKK